MYSLFLVIIAIIPSIALFYFVYHKDAIEKEPFYLLIVLFCLGILGTLLSININQFLKNHFFFLNIPSENWSFLENLFHSFIVISFLEESIKWCITFFTIWKNKNFDYTYDGILYAVVVALGFASLENIFYVLNYGFITGILRGILSVPGHAFFGVFTGYYLGLAKNNSNKKIPYLFLSLLVPILLHGIFDFLLLSNNMIYYLVFFIFLIVLYFFSIRKIIIAAKNDTKIKGH